MCLSTADVTCLLFMQENLREKIVLGKKDLFQVGGWWQDHPKVTVCNIVLWCVEKVSLLLCRPVLAQKGFQFCFSLCQKIQGLLGSSFPRCCGMEDLHSDDSLTNWSCMTLYLHWCSQDILSQRPSYHVWRDGIHWIPICWGGLCGFTSCKHEALAGSVGLSQGRTRQVISWDLASLVVQPHQDPTALSKQSCMMSGH